MTAELTTDERAVPPLDRSDAGNAAHSPDRRRPNVSGDLPALFEAAPMFRRSVAGYDRFQVDTYVQWAEGELATADREREHLLARHLDTAAALEEARGLLSHSAAGGEFLQASAHIATLLAAAADEAEAMRAEAAADRRAAADESARTLTSAQAIMADAEARADQLSSAAATEAAEVTEAARSLVERAGREADALAAAARAEASVLLESARLIEERAAEQADQIRRQSADEAAAVRLRARDEVLAMLSTGREERRRADDAAAAARERLDRDAATRLAAVLAEVDALERRRSALRSEIRRRTRSAAQPAVQPLHVPLRRRLETLRWRPRSLRTP